MIKERAMDLVAELRSGKHKQGKTLLHRVTGEKCCLGVACFISKVASPHPAERGSRGIRYGTQEEADVFCLGLSTLPRSVVEEFGFFNDIGSVRSGKMLIDGVPYYNLANANDKGVLFDKIADAIEANWERL